PKLALTKELELDGLAAGNDGSLDWIIMGDERADYMIESQPNADTLLMGANPIRVRIVLTKRGLGPQCPAVDRAAGANINAMHKAVFSTTLHNADCAGTRMSLPYRD